MNIFQDENPIFDVMQDYTYDDYAYGILDEISSVKNDLFILVYQFITERE